MEEKKYLVVLHREQGKDVFQIYDSLDDFLLNFDGLVYVSWSGMYIFLDDFKEFLNNL